MRFLAPFAHFRSFPNFPPFQLKYEFLVIFGEMVKICKFPAPGWKCCSSSTFWPSKMVTFGPTSVPLCIYAISAFLAKKAVFSENMSFSRKMMEFGENVENREITPQNVSKRLVLLLFSPSGGKSTFYVQICILCEKLEIC